MDDTPFSNVTKPTGQNTRCKVGPYWALLTDVSGAPPVIRGRNLEARVTIFYPRSQPTCWIGKKQSGSTSSPSAGQAQQLRLETEAAAAAAGSGGRGGRWRRAW